MVLKSAHTPNVKADFFCHSAKITGRTSCALLQEQNRQPYPARRIYLRQSASKFPSSHLPNIFQRTFRQNLIFSKGVFKSRDEDAKWLCLSRHRRRVSSARRRVHQGAAKGPSAYQGRCHKARTRQSPPPRNES